MLRDTNYSITTSVSIIHQSLGTDLTLPCSSIQAISGCPKEHFVEASLVTAQYGAWKFNSLLPC